MQTTISVQRAKQILDIMFSNAAAPYVANADLCDQILGWFGDNVSRDVYLSEITFKILQGLLGGEETAKVSPTCGMSFRQWAAIYQEAQSRTDLPHLEFPAHDHWPLVTYATTFVSELYRYQEKVDVAQGEVFIDCGAYILDTAIWALQKGASKVFAFEPNPLLMPQIHANKRQHDVHNRIELVSFGVSNADERIAFAADSTNSSTMNAKDDMYINTVTLDNFCAERGIVPTFIKMDIEGVGLKALQGASRTIAMHRPKLAVCIYHNPEDMWTLPHYIKALVPEYVFYMKKHSYENETVLYGVVE